MAGFIRRYGFYPGVETLRQIEGVVIVDAPPPGSIAGVGTGVAAFVGEFADMTHATTFDNAGVISTRHVPQEIFSSRDLIDKVGGFDPTLGDFGRGEGNGYAKLSGKSFARLVVVPVNLCSPQGARFFRSLPLCTAPTDPTPVVPVSGGRVEAGREFRVGAARIKIGKRLEFTARAPIATGVGGATNVGASAATQVFDADVGFDWSTIDRGDGTLGARVGDILVLNNAEAAANGEDAGTYRVSATPGTGNAITVQRLDGANFAWIGSSPVPWRLHFSTDADSAPERVIGAVTSGGYAFASAGGYVVPVRPMTNASGAQVTGTHAAGGLLAPALVPSDDFFSPDVLAGLGGALHPVTATDFTAATQGINPASSVTLDTLYATAFDALITEDLPARDVNIVASCRHSTGTNAKVRAHVLNASALGLGRIGVISPPVTTLTVTAARADAAPGVGANRDERIIYTWPGAVTQVPEANGVLLPTADGDTTSEGLLDEAFNAYMVSLLSNLPPERNPGQAAAPVPQVLASVLGIQRGVVGLGMGDYIAMKASGIAGLRIDRRTGAIIQSGITTALTEGRKNINRRRMADFIQDSVANRLVEFSKLPITNDFKDGTVAEVVAFLEELLSADNPRAQRIADFSVDTSANSPALEAQGIWIITGKVRTLATADTIVFQAEIGENVLIVRAT